MINDDLNVGDIDDLITLVSDMIDMADDRGYDRRKRHWENLMDKLVRKKQRILAAHGEIQK